MTSKRTLSPWLLIALFGLPFAAFVALLLTQGNSAGSIERRFSERPDLAETLAAYRQAYPEDYAAFIERAATTANARGEAEAERAAIGEIRAYLAAKSGAIAQAPAAGLHALGGALAGLAGQLQRFNPELCAQFVAQGVMDPARLPGAIQRGIGQVNALMFRAARAGEGSGAVARGSLSREDGAAWVARMAAIDPSLAGQIAGTTGADGPPQQCQRGVTLYRAAAELPEAQSANVTAHLVRQSFARR